jgi:ABC-type bacteriocin/lantibiotic exporter with double-glycine peptidase domain
VVSKASRSVSFNSAAPYKLADLSGNRHLMSFNDGSRVVANVPFFKQAEDNTCAQATTSVVLNYWGVKQDYQQLVDQQNHFNLATHYSKIVEYMKSKGLDAKAYRAGNIGYLKSLIDQGKPPIVLLEFNNDLMQQHYITVVGYNQAKGTIIFHDSIDGPFRQMDEDEFTQMWQSKHLANLPILGGANYQGLIIEASKATSN